uniref:Uncharacterized protein n=1 Tax=Kalanchoe fedtschenkoi TaxID=63787 RepID=A0A7N0T2T1_KALFE
MGFLDSLWDETVAGPAPDSAAGRLRKYKSLSAMQLQQQLSSGSVADDVPAPISRRITVLRHKSVYKNLMEPPGSPTGSESPRSPLSPRTPREDFKKLMRKRSDGYEKAEHTGYDWIVLSSLDR